MLTVKDLKDLKWKRVYVRVDGKYKVLEVKDLIDKDYSTMIGYYDKDPSYGGKIRVIVAY